MDTGRVLALSDGVFAIAATLLVLELRLPESTTDENLGEHLHELLPVFGGYALSYVLIGLLWLGHHRMFRNFTQVSARVGRLNLLFLGSVSVLPFVTSLLQYDSPIAAQLYAGVIAVIFLLEVAMSVVAGHRGHHADRVAARKFAIWTLVGAAVFVASIPIAWIPHYGPDLAKYFWILLAPLRLVLRRMR
jgi:TMEM175 potassium channel family protein